MQAAATDPADLATSPGPQADISRARSDCVGLRPVAHPKPSNHATDGREAGSHGMMVVPFGAGVWRCEGFEVT